MKQRLILAFFFLVFVSTFSLANNYYPADLTAKIQNHQLKDDSLKQEIFKLISKNQTVLGYGPAKKILFGQLHLKQNSSGYFVEDVYCKKNFNKGVGPNNLPDQNQVNTEHTWPQSKFTAQFPNEMQKSDLHHLFPTDSKANSTRGNFDFAEVTENKNLGSDCQASKSGPSVAGGTDDNFFEPPTDHKGNVARALFYFAVRYKLNIPKNELDFLRHWNDLDPVDQEEKDRNDAIEKLQGNRNPFIDFPSLAADISNF